MCWWSETSAARFQPATIRFISFHFSKVISKVRKKVLKALNLEREGLDIVTHVGKLNIFDSSESSEVVSIQYLFNLGYVASLRQWSNLYLSTSPLVPPNYESRSFVSPARCSPHIGILIHHQHVFQQFSYILDKPSTSSGGIYST